MATLLELCEKGTLEKIVINLEPNEQTWRCLYGTKEFILWLDETLPYLELKQIGLDINPLGQIDDIFYQYIAGHNLSLPRKFKKLNRSPDGYVWEFKTADLRVFGWFAKKDHFVCTYGDLKENILTFDKVGRYMAQTMFIREKIDLDEPKMIASKEYTDVLSIKN